MTLSINKEKIKEQILDCGIEDEKFGSKNHVGGYNIQQDPEELAGLVQCLQYHNEIKLLKSYLSIGVAAGGTDRFICESLGVEKFYCIDNDKHKKRYVWKAMNKPTFPCEVAEYVGDSHDEGAEQFLSACNVDFDLIGIDGDHSPLGVRLDWILIEPYLKKGTLVWFHDIAVCQGVMEIWEKLSSQFEVVFSTKESYGIGVIKV